MVHSFSLPLPWARAGDQEWHHPNCPDFSSQQVSIKNKGHCGVFSKPYSRLTNLFQLRFMGFNLHEFWEERPDSARPTLSEPIKSRNETEKDFWKIILLHTLTLEILFLPGPWPILICSSSWDSSIFLSPWKPYWADSQHNQKGRTR